MWENAGPFRTGAKLAAALGRIRQMQRYDLPNVSATDENVYNLDLQDWFELRAMLTTAERSLARRWRATKAAARTNGKTFPIPMSRCSRTK
jgi:succinate dehydrogenase/fumarate reductase flavoprotein subunit